jgi:hypothetical protein
MTNSIDERLDKLVKAFDELLGKHQTKIFKKDMSDFDRLIGLGLTVNEAKQWLKKEPNYISSDVSYHADKSDDKLPEPMREYFKCYRIRM